MRVARAGPRPAKLGVLDLVRLLRATGQLSVELNDASDGTTECTPALLL